MIIIIIITAIVIRKWKKGGAGEAKPKSSIKIRLMHPVMNGSDSLAGRAEE